MDIQRYDLSPGCARVAEANGFAYFTGHVCAAAKETLYEQTQAVLRRYGELFGQFGYEKRNIIMGTGYIADIDRMGEFERAWSEWVDRENPPALVCVEASTGNHNHYVLELGLIVATDSIPRAGKK